MHCRVLGRTSYRVSEMSFGTWAIGGSWSTVSDEEGDARECEVSGVRSRQTSITRDQLPPEPSV
jgi:aryl-alcohol dehydrogenase-like predicted oxidoreductase